MQKLSKRQLLKGLGGSAIAWATARYVLPPGPRTTIHSVPWPTKRRVRVAHLTDLHVGVSTPERTLKHSLEAVEKAQPDLVVLTGDYLNHSLDRLPDLRKYVRQISAPIIATLGNHDHWSGPKAIRRGLEAEGVRVLQNESLHVDALGLQLVGIDDGHTKKEDIGHAFHGAERPKDALVLQHAPATADAIAAAGGRLILSGHTHGGHVHVPHITPRILKRFAQPYTSGWYQVGEAQLYVNAGLGHSPLRAGHEAKAEVAIFDLVPEART